MTGERKHICRTCGKVKLTHEIGDYDENNKPKCKQCIQESATRLFAKIGFGIGNPPKIR